MIVRAIHNQSSRFFRLPNPRTVIWESLEGGQRGGNYIIIVSKINNSNVYNGKFYIM